MALPELIADSSTPGTVTAVGILNAECKIGDIEITTLQAAPVALQGAGQFRIVVDHEIMLVTGGATTTKWKVSRGASLTDESSAQTEAKHNSGTAVIHFLTSGGLKALLPLPPGTLGAWINP